MGRLHSEKTSTWRSRYSGYNGFRTARIMNRLSEGTVQTVDAARIFYRTMGNGPRTVLFMHGWGARVSGHPETRQGRLTRARQLEQPFSAKSNNTRLLRHLHSG